MDLCSVSIVHFFKSPEWFTAIKEHLSGASGLTNTKEQQHGLFTQILGLQVGESLVFSPSSFLRVIDDKPEKLGSKVIKMKTRQREGADGGVSVLTEAITNTCGDELNTAEDGLAADVRGVKL